MTTFVKVSGNWETATEVYVKRAGSWTAIEQFYVKPGQFNPPLDTTFWQLVFFSPGNYPYLSFISSSSSTFSSSGFYEPVLYPSGTSGTVQVPYGANRCRILMVGQGGAGGASASNSAAGAGGAGGAILTQSSGFAVNEFDTFNWSFGNENGITTSGDGANGGSFTVSWTGNSMTADGGNGGLASGTHGLGGGTSGSGTVYLNSTLTTGNSGFTNAWGFGEGGENTGSLLGASRGGYLYGEYLGATWTYPIVGGGGAGGYNSYGQKGGDCFVRFAFWRV
jgi:hypothetical protein